MSRASAAITGRNLEALHALDDLLGDDPPEHVPAEAWKAELIRRRIIDKEHTNKRLAFRRIRDHLWNAGAIALTEDKEHVGPGDVVLVIQVAGGTRAGGTR